MRLRHYGHAAFSLTTARGTTVLLDPYEPGCFGRAIRYEPIGCHADLVLVSHSQHAVMSR